MQDFAGTGAFVTGGARGIGLGLARAFVAQAMSVVLADIEPAALDKATGALEATGGKLRGIVCDRAELADSTIGVSVLCPGWVDTRIAQSLRNRPARFGPLDKATGALEERFGRILAAYDKAAAFKI
jgi:NAD(P)-dependent dehydrogenase (short-subunit alcohol dehydrogenase family)